MISVTPRKTGDDIKAREGAAFVLSSSVLAASFLLPLPGADGRIAHLPSVCPFYSLTGLPCPGCGLTRAFVCLAHGRLDESLHWHPLGGLLFVLCAAIWLRAGYALIRGVPAPSLEPRIAGRLAWALLALIIFSGAGRIALILSGQWTF